jgi:hypothetical protein
MKIIIKSLLLGLGLFVLTACSGPAIYTGGHAPVSQIGNTPSLAQVDKAVKDSLIGRGWIPQKVSANSYIGLYKKRSLMAKIKVLFNTSTFTIKHLESTNLDYDGSDQSIHPTYNRWIQNLERDIRKRVDRNVRADSRKR